MKLLSKAFNNEDQLPKKYSGEGLDINPPLEWENAPPSVQSFALILDDPDAPATKPEPWVHWIVFNIPAHVTKLDENAALATLGAKQGKTNSGNSTYHGAMPPPGNGVHRYYFKLYALDTLLNLPEGSTKQELQSAMKDHILAQAQLMATYERK